MKKLAVIALTLLSLLALAAPASANHSWSNYHWARVSNPFPVTILDAVNSSWDARLDDALSHTNNDWNDFNATDTPSGSNPVQPTEHSDYPADPKKCRPVGGKVLVCNASYGRNGWLGLAQIWISSGHITQGTAKMNDSYFSMARYNTIADRRLVMCQEVGHVFGIGHQDEVHGNTNLGTCMDYTSDADGDVGNGIPSNEWPNAHDYAQIATQHSHPDSWSSATASTQASRGEAPYHTRRHDTPGHTEIVEHFSDGSAKVTDILWADR